MPIHQFITPECSPKAADVVTLLGFFACKTNPAAIAKEILWHASRCLHTTRNNKKRQLEDCQFLHSRCNLLRTWKFENNRWPQKRNDRTSKQLLGSFRVQTSMSLSGSLARSWSLSYSLLCGAHHNRAFRWQNYLCGSSRNHILSLLIDKDLIHHILRLAVVLVLLGQKPSPATVCRLLAVSSQTGQLSRAVSQVHPINIMLRVKGEVCWGEGQVSRDFRNSLFFFK